MKCAEPQTASSTVARAVDIAGSMERLADFLCRPLADLRAWASGAPVPGQALLALREIVSAHELTIKALDHFEVRGRRPRRAVLADVF